MQGHLQFFMKEHDEAMKTYEQGLSHDKDNSELREGLMRCQQAINKVHLCSGHSALMIIMLLTVLSCFAGTHMSHSVSWVSASFICTGIFVGGLYQGQLINHLDVKYLLKVEKAAYANLISTLQSTLSWSEGCSKKHASCRDDGTCFADCWSVVYMHLTEGS